jgi:hypothetical protein
MSLKSQFATSPVMQQGSGRSWLHPDMKGVKSEQYEVLVDLVMAAAHPFYLR